MKSKEFPLISVIITVFNGEKYITEALQSIFNQDYSNLEVIVVDDGSTDGIRERIQQFNGRLFYYFQENGGIASAKNLGIEKATGDYFAFLDCDDLWVPEKTTFQLHQLKENPDVDMVFGHVSQFYSPEVSGDFKSKYLCPAGTTPGVTSCAMLISRENFYRVGLFDATWRKGIFNDWFLRASDKGLTWKVFPEVVLKRRIHEKNHGIVNRDKSVDYVRMLKASLDRKRKMGTGH